MDGSSRCDRPNGGRRCRLTSPTSPPPTTGGIGLVGGGLVRLGFAISFDRSGMSQGYTLDANGVPIPGPVYHHGDGGLTCWSFPGGFRWRPSAAFPTGWLINAVRRRRRRGRSRPLPRSCGYSTSEPRPKSARNVGLFLLPKGQRQNTSLLTNELSQA